MPRRVTPPGLSAQEYGRVGAERRWGPPRRIRLDDLTADQRRLVLALIDAVRSQDQAENADRP